MAWLARVALGAALVLSILRPTHAGAQRDTAAAARAFEEGQRAQLRGDHAQAARLFELAHRAAPAAAALRSAIRSHRSAGNDARAATLALQAQAEYPDDVDTATLAASTVAELTGGLARLEVSCAEPCTLTADGRLLSMEAAETHALFLDPGAHELVAGFDGRGVSRSIAPEAGSTTRESFEAPEPETAEPEPAEPAEAPEPAAPDPEPEPVTTEPTSSGGVSPALTFVMLGVTGALGGTMVWSLVHTFKGSDKYEADPTRERWEDGQDRIRRTWLLGVSTGALGLATILVAVLGTDWGADEPDDTRVRLTPSVGLGAGGLQLEGRF